MLDRPLCTACPLHTTCIGPVPGAGSDDPMVVIVGEAPGADEDTGGVPFIGKSGEVLEEALAQAGILREHVYITNVVKCRPPNNRDPHRNEVVACRTTFLDEEMRRFANKPWILLGELAISQIGERPGGVQKNEGRHWTNSKGLACWASWHPAAVLRGSGMTRQIAELLARAIGSVSTLRLIEKPRVLAVDTETDGLDPYRGRRPFMASTTDGQKGRVYDLRERLDCWRLQKEIDTASEIVMQNALFDVSMLASIGVKVPMDRLHDTRWSAALADSGNRPYDLEKLSDKYFGRGAVMKHRMNEYLRGKKLSDGYKDIPRELLEPYALEDAVLTWALHHHPSFVTARERWRSAYTREQRLATTLHKIERRGILVDLGRRELAQRALLRAMDGKLVQLRKDPTIAETIAGYWSGRGKKFEPFNPSSPLQVRAVCEALGIPTSEYTKSGSPSYAKGVLSASGHPLAEAIEEFRSLRTISGGAIENIQNVLDSGNCLHVSYDSVGSETGRFTGKTRAEQDRERINMMGLPDIPEVRGLFIARPGYTWVLLDGKQIEQRGLAHYANDPNLIRAYNENPLIDFYDLAGSLVYGSSYDRETMRPRMKAVVLARGYGAGVRKIAKMLKQSLEWTERFLQTFDEVMPGLAAFYRQVEEQVKTNGFVVAEDWPTCLDWRVSYQGVNRIDQGGCCVQLKRRLNEIDEMIAGTDDVFINHHVHDDISFDIRTERLDHWIPVLRAAFQANWNWKVPVIADVEIGPSWGQLETWKGPARRMVRTRV